MSTYHHEHDQTRPLDTNSIRRTIEELGSNYHLCMKVDLFSVLNKQNKSVGKWKFAFIMLMAPKPSVTLPHSMSKNENHHHPMVSSLR